MNDKQSGPEYFICNHEKQEPRLFTKGNGATCVVMQCLCCGERIGQEFAKTKYDVAKLPQFDVQNRDDWNERNKAIGDAYYTDIGQQNKLKISDWWKRYGEYLRSDHWQRVRSAVFVRDVACQCCFKYRPAECHHLSYKSYNAHGISFPLECVGLCRDCHQRLHEHDYVEIPVL